MFIRSWWKEVDSSASAVKWKSKKSLIAWLGATYNAYMKFSNEISMHLMFCCLKIVCKWKDFCLNRKREYHSLDMNRISLLKKHHIFAMILKFHSRTLTLFFWIDKKKTHQDYYFNWLMKHIHKQINPVKFNLVFVYVQQNNGIYNTDIWMKHMWVYDAIKA